jgi:tetratricopeptide (TPR) repeat protein
MTSRQCEFAGQREELARAFAAGVMPDNRHDAFETHLLMCQACQAEVRLALTVRHELRSRPAAKWRVPAFIGLAAAAALVITTFSNTRSSSALSGLGDVQVPPVYLGVPVRGAASNGLFESGMRLYEQGRWREAADTLAAAAAAGAPSDAAWFFNGASELMSGRATEAERAFARVLATPDGPYAPEAHLYRAKALIRLGRGRDALTALRRVTPGTSVAGFAGALADSLRDRGVR